MDTREGISPAAAEDLKLPDFRHFGFADTFEE